MATNFPNSLDSFTNPVGSNNLSSPSHADQHANVNDAVEAIEAKVGVDGSAVTSSLEYRITNGISDSLTVDTNTLVVDPTNNRVGVGTTSPSTDLHVSSGTAGDCELRIEADTDNNDEGDVPYITFAADGGILEAVIGLNDNRFTFASGVTSNAGFDFRTGTTNYYTNGADVVAGTTSRMTIDSAGRLTLPYQPFVQAKSNGGNAFVAPSSGSIWTALDSTFWGSSWVTSSNIGSHFNTSTARFTAPVAGVYYMTWSAYYQGSSGGTASYVHPSIFINGSNTWNNGQQPFIIYGHNIDGLQNGLQHTWTFYLNAGDYVQPAAYFRSTNDTFYGNYSYLSAGLLY